MTAQPVDVMPQSGALPTNYPDPDPVSKQHYINQNVCKVPLRTVPLVRYRPADEPSRFFPGHCWFWIFYLGMQNVVFGMPKCPLLCQNVLIWLQNSRMGQNTIGLSGVCQFIL